MNLEQEELDLSEILHILMKKSVLIILISLILALLGYIVSEYALEPKYESKATLLINSSKLSNDSITQTDVSLSKSLVYTYAEIAKSDTVKNKILSELGISDKDICKMSVLPVKDTQIIEIKVQAKSPILASSIVNSSIKYFTEEIKRIAKVDSVEIIDAAIPIEESVYPNTALNTIIAFILGFVFMIFIVLIIHYFDKTVKTDDDIELVTGKPSLGTIVKYSIDQRDKDNLIIQRDLNSPISEAYRGIRTGILFADVDNNVHKIIITSSNKSEGKSTTICNIAIAMSEIGKKVLLVDCDLRRPSIHRKFRLSNLCGLTNILLEKEDISKYIHKINNNLDVLTSGKKPLNPSELIGSKSMNEFINSIEGNYDYVLMDCAPMIVSDPIVLAQIADSIIYIVKSGSVEKDILKKNMEKLKITNLKLLGCVLNFMNIKDQKHGYYYYNSYYEVKNKTKKHKKQYNV